MPLLIGICDHVQLLPATHSRHHTMSAGMLIHSLQSASIALQIRLGEILPRGAASEDVHKREHRWTYGILLCSLFHDLGNLCSEGRVVYLTKDGDEKIWHPLKGTLGSVGAVVYRVLPPAGAGLIKQSAPRLSLLFLHRLVPAPILEWLAEDVELVDEMLLSLSGVVHDGAISQLTRRAHEESIAISTSSVGNAQRFVATPVSLPEPQRQAGADIEPPEPPRRTGTRSAELSQGDLLSNEEGPQHAMTSPSTPTMVVGGVEEKAATQLQLPATLSPLVREALIEIYDARSAQEQAAAQYLDNHGWFVSLESLHERGVDTGLALKCLLEADVLYLGGDNDSRKIHTRRIGGSEVRGIVISSKCVQEMPRRTNKVN